MVGLLGKAPLASDAALFIEVAVIVLLFVTRFAYARTKKLKMHGVTALVATALHAVTVLLVMVPSLLRSSNLLLNNFSSPAIILTWIHAPLGLVTLILGLYLVSEWRLRSPGPTCYKRAKLMRPLWVLWILSLVLGVLIYLAIAIYS
jgi:uncharacterized membrane protein YozB (DUF420 family)